MTIRLGTDCFALTNEVSESLTDRERSVQAQSMHIGACRIGRPAVGGNFVLQQVQHTASEPSKLARDKQPTERCAHATRIALEARHCLEYTAID